jgi:hypothetical protein
VCCRGFFPERHDVSESESDWVTSSASRTKFFFLLLLMMVLRRLEGGRALYMIEPYSFPNVPSVCQPFPNRLWLWRDACVYMKNCCLWTFCLRQQCRGRFPSSWRLLAVSIGTKLPSICWFVVRVPCPIRGTTAASRHAMMQCICFRGRRTQGLLRCEKVFFFKKKVTSEVSCDVGRSFW